MTQKFKRDIMGFKPFYYTIYKGRFFHSDDLDKLINASGISLDPDPDAMYSFLHYGAVALDKTMYKGIHRLPPAHEMVVTNNRIGSITRYWSPDNIETNHKISFDDAKKRFRELFNQALSKIDLDDPDLIIQLSGGLDSSSIVSCLARKHPDKTIRTVSMLFNDPTADERQYVDAVERKYSNIRHLHMEMNNPEHSSNVSPESIYTIQPHWPLFTSLTQEAIMLKKLAQRNVSTVVTGHGGDELMQGTPLVMSDHLRNLRWGKLYEELKLEEQAFDAFKRWALYPLLGDDFIKKIKRCAGRPLPKIIYPKNFIDPEDTFSCNSRAICREIGFLTSAMVNYLIESSFMFWAEKTHGMTFYHPFYDRSLMEFVISLPSEYKYRRGVYKYLLREALKQELPNIIYESNSKATYFGIARKRVEELDIGAKEILDLCSLGVISQQHAEEMISTFNNGKNSRPYYYSRLAFLAFWYRQKTMTQY